MTSLPQPEVSAPTVARWGHHRWDIENRAFNELSNLWSMDHCLVHTDSRIMKDGVSKAFEEAYTTQIVADGHSQVIVAADVTQDANDKQQMVPMLEEVKANLGRLPQQVSADTGYFSEAAVAAEAVRDVDLCIATERHRHGVESEAPAARPSDHPSMKEQMRAKLRGAEGRAVYARRKAIVEPV